MYRGMFSRDLLSQIDRLQRQLQQNYDSVSPNIRGIPSGYPALNVGTTTESVEIYAFAPGLDPQEIEIVVERGVLTVKGERPRTARDEGATEHVAERFKGRFRRVISLPEDADPLKIQAKYRDGVLHISVARRETSRPRKIDIQ